MQELQIEVERLKQFGEQSLHNISSISNNPACVSELESKVQLLENHLELMKSQKEDKIISKVHQLEMDLQSKESELAYLK